MMIERHVAFPLRVSCNFLVYTPKDEWASQPAAEKLGISKSKSSTTSGTNHQSITDQANPGGSTSPGPVHANPNPGGVNNAEVSL